MSSSNHPSADRKRLRLEEARSRLREAQEALDKAEREYGAASRDAHDPKCRYFNGMDMTCTCGVDP